jgi:pyridoxal/pyridoxine/pyridoxamine kinase
MTHQEIFRRLHEIIEQIDENKKFIYSGAFEEPQQIVVIGDWLDELEELKEKVKESIK